jgi:CBS-domain-containing membrane protein
MEIGKILDHIIDKDVYTVSNQSTIQDAAKKMLNKYNLVAVTGEDSKINRVFSNTDITHILSNQSVDSNEKLNDIVIPSKYERISAKDKVEKLLDIIIDNKMDSVVIEDDAGTYYGIINKNKLKEEIEDMVE